jgi:hypothetical protein
MLIPWRCTCAVTIFRCKLSIMALPSAIVKPTVAGVIRSSRSMVTTSCSMSVPGWASATSFTVHFIPPAYVIPQLCMLSPASKSISREVLVNRSS